MRHARILTAIAAVSGLLAVTIIASCSKNPASSSPSLSASALSLSQAQTTVKTVPVGGPPGYEEAFVNDTTVWINAIELNQNPTEQAQADFYEVVYPFDPATGQELTGYWPSTPQCNPCDHQGDGITPDDFHDHVLDSRPSDPTGREYNALWHVYVIMPNYTADAAHNTAVNTMLQSMLPVKSEAEMDALTSTQVDGIPLANEIDTHFYFLCAVVGQGAGTHGAN
jgi:hypothetical protein